MWSSVSELIGQRILHTGSSIHQHSVYDGYWGNATSTVDWCEANYEITHYVAEFFNTISSLAMVITGVAGALMHRNNLETRFILGFLGVAIVGIGSAAFHGTLWFGLQMLDELPMIYSALILVYTVLEHDHVKRKYGDWLPVYLVLHALVSTILVALPVVAPQHSSPILQFIAFHLSFAVLEVFLFVHQIRVWRIERNPEARRLHSIGFLLWSAGIACWLLDYLGCKFLWEGDNSLRKLYLFVDIDKENRLHLPNPQFHSWWHICASGGLYILTIAVAFHRQASILRRPTKITSRYWLTVLEPATTRTHGKGGNTIQSAAHDGNDIAPENQPPDASSRKSARHRKVAPK